MRKIGFNEFLNKSIPQMAAKKYPGVDPEEAQNKLIAAICQGNGPVTNSVKADQGGILDKLTDTSLYTGAHKARFDDGGHGLGAAGRVDNTGGISDLSQITRNNLGPKAQGIPTATAASSSVAVCQSAPGIAPPPAGGAAAAAAAYEPATGAEAVANGADATVVSPAAAPAPKRTSRTSATKAKPVGESANSLKDAFNNFCSFGARGAAPEMDNAKFAKLFRDCKLINSALSATGVDLIFSKVKLQGQRKITYEQFEKAIYMAAEKLHPDKSPDEGYELVKAKILKSAGPMSSGTNAKTKGSIFDKLTDSSQYTGAHKARFGSDGKGLGAAGRVQNTAGVSDLSQITRC